MLNNRANGTTDNIQLTALALAPDKSLLATAWSDNRIRLWEMDTLDKDTSADTYIVSRPNLTELTGHTNLITHLFFDNSGQIMSADLDGNVRFWRPQTQIIRNGENILAKSEVDSNVYNLILRAGAANLAVDSEGKYLAITDTDDNIIIWSLPNALLGNPVKQDVLTSPARDIKAITISPDGQYLAVGQGRWVRAGDINNIYVWSLNDLAAPPLELTGHIRPINSLTFTPDSRFLVSSSGVGPIATGSDNQIRMWDTTDWSGLPDLLPQQAADGLTFAQVSPDGTVVALGSRDGSIWLLPLTDLQANPTVLNGPNAPVTAIVFSPDSEQFASGSSDGSIRVWDMDDLTAEPILLHVEGGVTAMAYMPDGRFLSTAGEDQTVRLWQPDEPTNLH